MIEILPSDVEDFPILYSPPVLDSTCLLPHSAALHLAEDGISYTRGRYPLPSIDGFSVTNKGEIIYWVGKFN